MGAIKDSQWEYKMVPPLLPVLWQYLFIKSLFKNAFDSVINSTSGNLLQGKKVRDCLKIYVQRCFL